MGVPHLPFSCTLSALVVVELKTSNWQLGGDKGRMLDESPLADVK